ncbi:hypothetical protein Tsp_16039, partial [Trichinella spiralis]|uniref:hypothetical protein n=1 Tax=Trichinella spiralis TaxID=6334 RepID=UPI0001EFDAFA
WMRWCDNVMLIFYSDITVDQASIVLFASWDKSERCSMYSAHRPQQRGRRMLSLFNRLPAFGGNRPCAPGCYFTVVLHLAESKEHGSSSCAEFSRLQQLQKIRLIFTFHLDTSVRGGGVLQGANWLFDFPAQPVPCGDHNLLPPSVARLVFALAMYFLPGATLALLFPVVTSRKLPGEVCIYWIQHLIIVLCPVYLLSFTEMSRRSRGG